jgi:hypothetical protein
MDSTAQTAPVALEIFNETSFTGDAWIRQRKEHVRPQKSSPKVLPRVTHGFDTQTAPVALEIFNETVSTGDAWIHSRKQPLRPQKSSPKVLPRVTHGFDIANGPCGLRNLQRNCFHS